MNPLIQDRVIIQELESLLITEVSGDLQFFEYTYLSSYLQDKSKIFKTMIVDLNKVNNINSTTIGMLLSFISKKETNLKLVCDENSKIYKILNMYKVLSHFDVSNSIEIALAGSICLKAS